MPQDSKLLDLQRALHPEPIFQFGEQPAKPDPYSGVRNALAQGEIGAWVTELLDIHEYERERIGQELHDSAGQLLVSLQLSVARLRVLEQNCERESLMDEIQDTIRLIDKEIRTLAFLDHPAELRDRSLCDALRSLVTGFARRTGIRTTFKCPDNPPARAESVAITLLRVAQEALVNVHRHSHATCAKVMIQADAHKIRLTVSDNGIGIQTGAREVQGVGLHGMEHRVEMHGGRFNISRLNHGTKIIAIMPLVA